MPNFVIQIVAYVAVLGLQLDLAQANEDSKGRQLIEEEVVELFSGTVMFGKYTDGRPDWKEQTSANGTLLDAADEWSEVGTWTVIADMVCYRYWDHADTHCFDVFERENAFYFYLPGTDILVAYSYKVEKRPMM